MSDYLVNLALRAAGSAVFKPDLKPGLPAARWDRPDTHEAIPEEIHHELPPALVSPLAARESDASSDEQSDSASPAPPRPESAPRQRSLVEAAGSSVPQRATPVPPERVREIQTTEREILREAAAPPRVEIHETVREKETVRETIVERDVRADAPAPREPIPPTSPRAPQRVSPLPSDVGRALETAAAIREAVIEQPISAHTDSNAAAPRPPAPPVKSRADEAASRAAEPAAGRSEKRAPDTAAPAAVPRPGRPPVQDPVSVRSPRVDQDADQPDAAQRTPEPALRPAPLAASLTTLPRARKPPAPEKSVEVKIGSIEIRTAAPPAARTVAEPVVAPKPLEGFEAYRRVRRYSSWFRE